MSARLRAAPRAFPTGGIVPAEDLVGREPVIAELFERTFRQRNSVVLSAPRQTGKTSVIMELLRRVRDAGGWGVYVDCSAPADLADVATLIAAATYDEAAGSRDAFARLRDLLGNVPRPILFHADSNVALAFHSERPQLTPTQKLERAAILADTLALERDKHVVVVYDEFPLLRKLSTKVFDQMRAFLQHANKRTAYIFMGSETGILAELFRTRRRMPFRLGVTLSLPRPTDQEWAAYVERRFRELGHPLGSGGAAELVQFAGGHPRDLMEACQHLLTIRKLKAPDRADLALAQARTLEGLRRHFEDVWNSIEQPRGTRLTAVRIARGEAIYGRRREPKQVKRTLDKLEGEGLIRRVARGEYEFTEPLFARFIGEISERS